MASVEDDPTMAEGTRSASLKSQRWFSEVARNDTEAVREPQHAINRTSEMLDQLTNMFRSLIASRQSNLGQVESHELRGLGYEDRSVVPRGIYSEFPHFDGNDPAAWIFKIVQFLEFHQTPSHQKLLIASYHMEGEAFF